MSDSKNIVLPKVIQARRMIKDKTVVETKTKMSYEELMTAFNNWCKTADKLFRDTK